MAVVILEESERFKN